MKAATLITATIVVAFASCLALAGEESAEAKARKKIRFNLAKIDASGLIGPPGGKVAVDYEFCIPNKEEFVKAVKRADPSVQMHRGSRGRIGCGKDEFLCIGNTHQKEWRKKILALAAMPYIKEIRRCFWE